jgi:hypothetical protein
MAAAAAAAAVPPANFCVNSSRPFATSNREKVLEEQNRVLGDSKTVDHDHVKQMDYLDACIRESLRTTSFLRTTRYTPRIRALTPIMINGEPVQSARTGWR